MDWVALVVTLVKVVVGVLDFLSRRQLLDAARAEVIAEGLKETLATLEKHDAVKKELADNPSGDYVSRLRNKYERADEPE
jgi:hypothetical protein